MRLHIWRRILNRDIAHTMLNETTKSFPLHDLDAYRSSSCKFCTDLTAENPDISFGGVGSPQGWTTVLARSGIGYEIFNEAVDSGYIRSKTLEEN